MGLESYPQLLLSALGSWWFGVISGSSWTRSEDAGRYVFGKPPHQPTKLVGSLRCRQLPDDARRLAFAPVQSSEPFRPEVAFCGGQAASLEISGVSERESSLFSGESGYAPEINIAPENGWLEDEFCFGKTCFQVQAVCFREGSFRGCTWMLVSLNLDSSFLIGRAHQLDFWPEEGHHVFTCVFDEESS